MDASNTLEERRDRFEALAAEVFEPLQRYLRRRASADEAEEAFGDTLLTLWRRVDDVPAEAPLAWSYGVARRVLANRRRGSLRQRRLVERIAGIGPPQPDGDPAAIPDYPEVAAALETLREEDREVLTLWAWEQLEPREIALVMGVSVNAATLRLGKAKKRLAGAMSGQTGVGAGHIGVEHTEGHT